MSLSIFLRMTFLQATPEPTRAIRHRQRRCWLVWLWTLLIVPAVYAQTCENGSDMDVPTRTAIEATAKRYFQMSIAGDAATLKQNAIPSLATSFSGVEAALKENQSALTAAKAEVRPPFLLTAEGTAPLTRAEFLCGVFGPSGQTKGSAVFVLPNLPPGKYAVAVLDVTGGQTPKTLTFVLQQIGTDWKLAGFYARSSQASGHDAAWFTQRAQDFKAKSQTHNAWLYYREAIALSAPVDFMSTLSTDQLYDAVQAVQPTDFPAGGGTVDLAAAGTVYHLIEIFPLASGNDLEVVVKYQAADVSNTAHAFQENTIVIKAFVAKFPELREAFAGVVARAVDPSGHDFGSLIAMKDIK